MRKVLFLVLFTGLALACTNTKLEKERQYRVSLYQSAYVYQSPNGVIHYDPACYEIQSIGGTPENIVVISPEVNRIEKRLIADSLFKRCCSKCIDDTTYVSLKRISVSKIKAPWVK